MVSGQENGASARKVTSVSPLGGPQWNDAGAAPSDPDDEGRFRFGLTGNDEPFQVLATGLQSHLGIYFLRPYWSRRDFSIGVPGGNGANGIVLADTRDVSNDYTVAPVVDVTVQFTNLQITFSGLQYALSSSVDQAVNAGGANASLTGTSSLTLREATIGEVRFPLPLPECFKGCFKDGGQAEVGVGPYYLYVDQAYAATLVSGSNKATLTSHENYEGFGLVGTLNLTTGRHFFSPTTSDGPSTSDYRWYCDFYSNFTGAILMGTNKRMSDFSITGGLALQYTTMQRIIFLSERWNSDSRSGDKSWLACARVTAPTRVSMLTPASKRG
jgi:hypothetical protein